MEKPIYWLNDLFLQFACQQYKPNQIGNHGNCPSRQFACLLTRGHIGQFGPYIWSEDGGSSYQDSVEVPILSLTHVNYICWSIYNWWIIHVSIYYSPCQIELFQRHNRWNRLRIITLPMFGNKFFQFQLLSCIATNLYIILFKTIQTPINGYCVGLRSSDADLEVIWE